MLFFDHAQGIRILRFYFFLLRRRASAHTCACFFGESESKIELIYENGALKEVKIQEIKGREPLSSKDLNEAVKFVKKYHEGIVEKWTDFFVRNKKVKCEVINQKIK